jgi:hypothetical protein
VVQAGGFATHEFDGTAVAGGEERPDVDGRWVAVELEPGAGGRVELGIDRYRHLPSYETPWADPEDVGRIRDRSARDDDDMAQLDRDDFVGL